MSGERLDGREFRALMDLAMSADPMPEGVDNQSIISLLTEEATARGYESWYVAYHEHEPEETCPECGCWLRADGSCSGCQRWPDEPEGMPDDPGSRGAGDALDSLWYALFGDDPESLYQSKTAETPDEDPRGADQEDVDEAMAEVVADVCTEPDPFWNTAGGGPETGDEHEAWTDAGFRLARLEDEALRDPCSCGPRDQCDECPEWKSRLAKVEQQLHDMARHYETSDGRPPVDAAERLDEIEEAAGKARADTKDERTPYTLIARVERLERAVDDVEHPRGHPDGGEKASVGVVGELTADDVDKNTAQTLLKATHGVVQEALRERENAGKNPGGLEIRVPEFWMDVLRKGLDAAARVETPYEFGAGDVMVGGVPLEPDEGLSVPTVVER